MPLRFEGLTMVAPRAMQASMPRFASGAGPVRESVQDGVSGRLFPGESPNRIVAKIASIIDVGLMRSGEAEHRVFQAVYDGANGSRYAGRIASCVRRSRSKRTVFRQMPLARTRRNLIGRTVLFSGRGLVSANLVLIPSAISLRNV